MATDSGSGSAPEPHASTPGAAKRPYLPQTRERQGPPHRRVALSEGARPLQNPQTERNVQLYNLPAPTALPPPDDVTRGSGSPASHRPQQPLPTAIRTFNCRLSAVTAKEAHGRCRPHFGGPRPSGARRRDVSAGSAAQGRGGDRLGP